MQNNWWDYHPYDDIEDLGNPLYMGEKEEADEDYHPATDKYKGGYFYPGNSWGRYLHINALKSHIKVGRERDFKRLVYTLFTDGAKINNLVILPTGTVGLSTLWHTGIGLTRFQIIQWMLCSGQS